MPRRFFYASSEELTLGADGPTCYELEEIDVGILGFAERVGYRMVMIRRELPRTEHAVRGRRSPRRIKQMRILLFAVTPTAVVAPLPILRRCSDGTSGRPSGQYPG